MLAIDLHECRWFHVRSFDPDVGATGLSYYMTRDGRWIGCEEEEDLIDESTRGPVFGITRSYFETRPEEVAHALLEDVTNRGRLCPELEPYREFGDFGTYHEWERRLWQLEDDPEERGRYARPRWDQESRRLYLGTAICLEYARRADNQFILLEAFESARWPESIPSPFRSVFQLNQTIKDIGRKLPKPAPLRFICGPNRAIWRLETRFPSPR
ncbi:hypothetical protein [Planctomyces sp. SH-PL62]|uniref:hypothetical protein n=1 Tax=Planctomyces sp. SH-PL62 TaxID=1636152 RepID=UPI000838537A|nr:hypothetical protein [Planctomyces sp. SH-PL62]